MAEFEKPKQLNVDTKLDINNKREENETLIESSDKVNTENKEDGEKENQDIQADDLLKIIIRREIAQKIQENFQSRKNINELGFTQNPEIKEGNFDKRSFLEFDYLRHNLLLSDILDKVVEKGFVGTVKKRWKVILDDVKSNLKFLNPESRQAIIDSVSSVFEKRAKIEQFIQNSNSEKVFNAILENPKSPVKPEGILHARCLGDILTINLENPVDFARAYFKKPELSKVALQSTKKIGGFATSRHIKKIGDTDVIVFPFKSQDVYRSTLTHEISHRISDRLFEPDYADIEEIKKDDAKDAQNVLNRVLQYWKENRLKDELWNQALSGLMHYDNCSWNSGMKFEKILAKHIDNLLGRGEGAFYDYPKEESDLILRKLNKLFPEEDQAIVKSQYKETSDKFYAFVNEKVAFLKKNFSEIKGQDLRYLFLNLLRFENIDKWPRLARFLETIGDNVDSLSKIIQNKNIGDYNARIDNRSSDTEALREKKKLEIMSLWQLNTDSFHSGDNKAKALMLLKLINEKLERSEEILIAYYRL